MQAKIEWFQEVLSLEPGSKVFFPLAKLFVEIGERENAVTTLKQGLARHPDHLEARLLLVDLLVRLGRPAEARDQLGAITEPLVAFPGFWRLWAQKLLSDNKELAVFLMLVASNLTGKEVRWTDVVLEGLNSLSERLVGQPEPEPAAEPAAAESAPEPPAPAAAESAPEAAAPAVAPEPAPAPEAAEPPALAPAPVDAGKDDDADAPVAPPPGIRTRTMADLLATQGDSRAALDIYRELWNKARSDEEKAALAQRIEALEAGLAAPAQPAAPPEDPFSKHAKNRLISTLEALASRFEARVRAAAPQPARS
ncbi:MAG: tetratricopeptide repeat protein [Desulfovibrionaceae bacterium]